eukprot:scpid96633/ scgid28602/ 
MRVSPSFVHLSPVIQLSLITESHSANKAHDIINVTTAPPSWNGFINRSYTWCWNYSVMRMAMKSRSWQACQPGNGELNRPVKIHESVHCVYVTLLPAPEHNGSMWLIVVLLNLSLHNVNITARANAAASHVGGRHEHAHKHTPCARVSAHTYKHTFTRAHTHTCT